MKYGVRNQLKAEVTKIKEGTIMAQVECKLTAADKLTSILSVDSVRELNIKEGDQLLLLVKAIHVIPAKED